MGGVNLQDHLLRIAYKVLYFAFWLSKISVISKQNDRYIGGVSNENCFSI